MKLILSLVTCALSLLTTVHAAPRVAPRADTKYVFAHHIVGNTFPYTQATWTTDINLAKGAGIDGFALNVGSEDWEPARVADAYVKYLLVSTSELDCAIDMQRQRQPEGSNSSSRLT